MKTLISAMALATLVASPAFAQSYDPDLGSGNITPPAYARSGPWVGSATGAFARIEPGTYAAWSQRHARVRRAVPQVVYPTYPDYFRNF